MATYAIGDIQGCFEPLQTLLKKIDFNPSQDQLWLAGDMINRGPNSLETLREIVRLDQQYQCIQAVLGNHDLHFLAIAQGHKKPSRHDTLNALLQAPDRLQLIQWLRKCPLMHSAHNFHMVHAGIPPQWSIAEAQSFAREVESVLQSTQYDNFLAAMYGNQPDLWQDKLQGNERLRIITNYFTRMRFCDPQGKLEFESKNSPQHAPAGTAPWFSHPQRKAHQDKIIIGHWAALKGDNLGIKNIYPLDTGCVWDGALTAMRLEDEKLFSVAGISLLY